MTKPPIEMTDLEKTREALQPCPFCGGEADINFNNGVFERQYYVHCCGDIIHGCVVQDATYARKTDAIKAWNTRKALEQKPVDVEALKRVRDYINDQCERYSGAQDSDEFCAVSALCDIDEVLGHLTQPETVEGLEEAMIPPEGYRLNTVDASILGRYRITFKLIPELEEDWHLQGEILDASGKDIRRELHISRVYFDPTKGQVK